MKTKFLAILFTLFIITILAGCSQVENPTAPSPDPSTALISESDNVQSGLGVLGAYTVKLDPVAMTVEMTPLRQSTIGESFLVDGMKFFTWFPCTDCFGVCGIWGDSNGLALQFYVTHPLPAGNPANPPSGSNRLDLDVFDLAIVVEPYMVTPQHFPLMNKDVATDFCMNQNGYTTELSDIYFPSDLACPYFLVIDDNFWGTFTYNKFPMGEFRYTNVFFKSSTSLLIFNTYLTFGYGASATFWQRLTPKYYNPEFNRKAAWKIKATPAGNWPDNSLTPVNVRVEVWDWQQGATVYPNPSDFANAPIEQIYEQSDVSGVWIEIPGMHTNTFYDTVPDSGTGMPADPLVYNIQVTNYNVLPAGIYTGLVMVIDTAIPDHSGNPSRGCIITTGNGRDLIKHDIPEYITYQTFTAVVIIG